MKTCILFFGLWLAIGLGQNAFPPRSGGTWPPSGTPSWLTGANLPSTLQADKQAFCYDSALAKWTSCGVQAPVFSNSLFYDNFQRADQSGLGTATSGQTWTLAGSGSSGCQISGNRYVLIPNSSAAPCYASFIQSPKPARLEGTFDVTTSTGGTSPQWAIISSSDSSLTLQHMVHLAWSLTSLNVSTWNAGANMVPLGTCPLSITFNTPLAVGQTYNVGMTIIGNTVHVDSPDGQSFTCTDPLVSTVSGTLAVYEIINSNTTGSGLGEWLSARTYQTASASMPNSSSIVYMPVNNPDFGGTLTTNGAPFLGNSGTGYNTIKTGSVGLAFYSSTGALLGILGNGGGLTMVTGPFAGSGSGLTGIPESAVTNLTSDLASNTSGTIGAARLAATFTGTVPLNAPLISFSPTLPYTKTYTGPERVIEFNGGTGGSTTAPYLLSSYFTSSGAYATGASVIISNKRSDIYGTIQGCSALADGSEPNMFCISQDVNGPSGAFEGYSALTGGQTNATALAVYDLSAIIGGAGANTVGYGTKKWAMSGNGTQYWAANLSNSITANAEVTFTVLPSDVPTFSSASTMKFAVKSTGNDSGYIVNGPASGHVESFAFQKNGTTTWQFYETTSATPDYAFLDPSGNYALYITNNTAKNWIIGGNGDAANGRLQLNQTRSLTSNTADGYAASLSLNPTYDVAWGLTRHNYINVPNVLLTNGATVTDAAVFRFNAAAGTHKAVDSSTTKTTPGAVDAWVKININGTIHYMPAFLNKTT